MPSFSRGFSAFMWALFLGAFIWIGMVAIGITGATSFIVGCVAGLGIFLYVRAYGRDEPAQSAARRRAPWTPHSANSSRRVRSAPISSRRRSNTGLHGLASASAQGARRGLQRLGSR